MAHKYNLYFAMIFEKVTHMYSYVTRVSLDPSNLSFVRIYAQGLLAGFYGMPTWWNQQPSRYVFSKVIECLEQTLENKKTNRLQKTHRVQNKWT